MIVKILKKSVTFKGVRYNTNKVDKDKGELMAVKNFGALHTMEQLRPMDYINYLNAISAQSKRTKYPQLHVVISTAGKSQTKEELTIIAEKWLKGMGYGDQPYLLIFHKDTSNNHIHLVSTRVGKDGKKISDSFEKLKAYQVLNRIEGIDETKEVITKLDKALSYNFSTRPQFMMLLEAQGYTLVLSDDHYKVCKYGNELTKVFLDKVDEQITNYDKKVQRIKQLHAIFKDYRLKFNPAIYSLTQELPGGKVKIQTGHSSKLAEVLRDKFGIEVFFHSKDNKLPYGYTVIDHSNKAIFKGKQIMDLADFIMPQAGVNYDQPLPEAAPVVHDPAKENEESDISMRAETKSNDYIDNENLSISAPSVPDSFNPSLYDESVLDLPEINPDISDDIGGENLPISADCVSDSFNASLYDESGFNFLEINLDISEDIDDEAILGRNRQRKRKARSNTR
ncbi:relaxase/mobilization nuclease domain-containing protein [Pedobacter gandavensis]|uniref:relaxase/mobilization nuclease domain-containing protein n=1 Tax=Pedobacter gandavensis TaxID=2679963 RepID=UPI0024783532|nr:relaxase/mobilization nuclease domain-containing protein [Pedobacter gandavensis]WGQ08971.1 relaxase/mobilization nuclease domain-containing protein [Pedobacter gandavensis]